MDTTITLAGLAAATAPSFSEGYGLVMGTIGWVLAVITGVISIVLGIKTVHDGQKLEELKSVQATVDALKEAKDEQKLRDEKIDNKLSDLSSRISGMEGSVREQIAGAGRITRETFNELLSHFMRRQDVADLVDKSLLEHEKECIKKPK